MPPRAESPLAPLPPARFLTGDAAILLSRGNDRALAELVLQALMLQQRGETISELTHALEGAVYYRSCQPERVASISGIFALPEVKPLKTAEPKKWKAA
ncbi:MAG: hypothetical protein IPK22_11075 [Verrucomicrobiaceae bacterium]|nr:hypothetical protein [Verrucomicrobiaceae bacterium]